MLAGDQWRKLLDSKSNPENCVGISRREFLDWVPSGAELIQFSINSLRNASNA